MLAWWVLNQGEYTPYPVGTSPSPPSPDPFILISTSMDTLPLDSLGNILKNQRAGARAGGGMFRPGMGGGPGRGGGQVAPLSEDNYPLPGREAAPGPPSAPAGPAAGLKP